MSAFSFTAPFITEEEEKIERQNLSEEDRLELNCDLFGKDYRPADSGQAPSQDLIDERVQQIREIIDREIPQKQKQEYLEACERAPELVSTESDPAKFLRCCRYDAQQAAARLVQYWKVRKELFGHDRAFLSMTLAGSMKNDLTVLRKALVQVLQDDEHGRPVLFWDRIRSVKTVITRDEVARIHFYMFHVMAKRESVQQKGYVYMVFLKGYDLYSHFDRILDKKLFKVMNAIPTKFRAIHTFTGSGQSVVGLVMPVVKYMAGKHYRLRLIIHAGSDKELLERLDMYGVTGDHLEAYVGGRYNREQTGFLAWLDNERRQEEEEAASASASAAAGQEDNVAEGEVANGK